jgi:hypothetical protein
MASHRGGPGSIPGHVGFVVDKVALEQVFSEYFGFPCQSSFHQLLHDHHRSSGAGTIGQQRPMYHHYTPFLFLLSLYDLTSSTLGVGIRDICKYLPDYVALHPTR